MEKLLKRISSMRSCARRDGKHVPSVDEIISAWPENMRCPKCDEIMVLSAKESWHRCATLQHLKKDGEYAGVIICCMSCNAAWRNLGDEKKDIDVPDHLRKCKICNLLKSLDEFILQKNSRGNMTRSSYCNGCRKSHSREYSLEYRSVNKNQRNADKRQGYLENREKELNRKREYYLANKEKILAKAKERASKK